MTLYLQKILIIFILAFVFSYNHGYSNFAHAKGGGNSGGGNSGGGNSFGKNNDDGRNNFSNLNSNPNYNKFENNVKQRGLSSLQILDPGKANKNEKSYNARLSATVNFITKFDVNGDGQVTKDEVINLNKVKFNELNINGIGEISKEDLISTLATRLNEETSSIFNIIDKNNDGLISSGESFNTHNQLTSLGADLNEDGRISLEEYNNYNLEQVVEGTIEELDTNQDGSISEEEYSENSLNQFETLDTNNTEVISADN